MRSFLFTVLAGLVAREVAGHATWQRLYVDGVDQISPKLSFDRSLTLTTSNGATCARLPVSNNPVTNVASADIACNAGASAAASKCAVKAGGTVTVEMHQQPNTAAGDCSSEAIGGAHYGPVQVYMSKVSDASTAVGASSGWFKIFADTWASKGASGSDDAWGTKDLNTCCGKMVVKIPSDVAPGDYLLRSEAIALHAAAGSGGAQFYVTCYQITVTGSGTAAPATVKLPGAYSASDPGILINIYQKMTSYIAPGPAVYSGGSTKVAGSTCATVKRAYELDS